MPAYPQPNSAALLYDEDALVAGQTLTASGNSAVFNGFQACKQVKFLLTTGVATGTTPSLTVNIQDSLDGVNWSTVTSFTAVTASNASQYVTITTPLALRLRFSYVISGTTPNFAGVNISCASWAYNV